MKKVFSKFSTCHICLHFTDYDCVSDWYEYYNECEDKSDQIFLTGTKCDPINSVRKYCHQFCQPEKDEKHPRCREDVCAEPESWLEENLHWLRERRGDILDPHHCQQSCREPGLGCEACTNLDYFHCVRNNVSVCLHPDLVCDSHPHCDQAEDERITDRACYDKLLRKGRIREDATVQCMSKMYKSRYLTCYDILYI